MYHHHSNTPVRPTTWATCLTCLPPPAPAAPPQNHSATETGATALHYAAFYGRIEELNALLREGADPGLGSRKYVSTVLLAPPRDVM